MIANCLLYSKLYLPTFSTKLVYMSQILIGYRSQVASGLSNPVVEDSGRNTLKDYENFFEARNDVN